MAGRENGGTGDGWLRLMALFVVRGSETLGFEGLVKSRQAASPPPLPPYVREQNLGTLWQLQLGDIYLVLVCGLGWGVGVRRGARTVAVGRRAAGLMTLVLVRGKRRPWLAVLVPTPPATATTPRTIDADNWAGVIVTDPRASLPPPPPPPLAPPPPPPPPLPPPPEVDGGVRVLGLGELARFRFTTPAGEVG